MIAFVKIIAAPGVKGNSGSWVGTGVVFPTLNPSKLLQQGDGELLAESSFYISDTISFYMQTSLFLNHVQRTIDPVLVDPHDFFFTWSHRSVLGEDGTSSCLRSTNRSISQMYLLHEPS